MSMIKSVAIISAVAVLSVFAGYQFAGPLDSVAADGTPKVRAINAAVVDIEEVTTDYLRNSGQLDVLHERKSQQRNMLRVLGGQLEAQRSNLDIYPQDDPRYMEAQIDIAIKSAELKVRGEAAKLTDNSARAKLMSEVYQKAVEVIRIYASSKNIDVVFLKQEGEFNQTTVEGVSSNILVRSVIFAKDELDITQEIKDRMK